MVPTLVVSAACVTLIVIVAVRTMIFSERAQKTPCVLPDIENTEAVKKLSGAVQFRTESFSDFSKIDMKEYTRFHEFLATSFPLVHRHLERIQLSGFSTVYTWKGKRNDLEPVLLMAHWDVVPVSPSEEKGWEEPPYSGNVSGGFIWGRGSLDDKLSLISILEAVETLLAGEYQPERTVYLAFGGDEEVGGLKGAAETARYFEKNGIRFSWVLDEASIIIEGGLLGITRPIALIGIAEKGHADITVTATGQEGHASMPPRSTAAGILARAIGRIERRPPRPRLLPLVRRFLEALAPYSSPGLRIALANLWLTGPIVLRVLGGTPSSNSLIRTTRAFTVLEGSSAENVLPEKARAVANCRILPGDSVEHTLKEMERAVGDQRVKIDVFRSEDSGEPVPASPMDGEGYRALTAALSGVLPGVVPAPFLFNATTDSRHFAHLSRSVLRFMPVVLKNEDLSLFHGTNERVSVQNLGRYVAFIVHLLRNL